MPVTCPHCSARYVLPASLLGPGGARVRCPKCKEPFGVAPDGTEVIPLPVRTANAPAPPAPAPEPVPADPEPEVRKVAEAVQVAELPRPAEAAKPATPAATVATEPAADPVETPATIARQVIDDLASHSGAAMVSSLAAGRLFADFGDVIAEAFDAYRLRVGSDADPAPFRAAIRERWAVDLDPGIPPKRFM